MPEPLQRPLVVGSWPGRDFKWNSFIGSFGAALEAAGCEVVDVHDPRKLTKPIDVLHIHWPEQMFWGARGVARLIYRTFGTLRALARLQRSGVKLVWMVHNLQPHDRSGARGPLWFVLSRRLAAMVDGFMTLSPATVPVVRAAFPALAGKPYAQAWHPAYEVAHGPAARESRPATAYAFLGQVRPYKGVAELIRVFSADPNPARSLVIGGEAAPPEFKALVESLAAADPRITLRLERLGDDEMAERAAAADVIVLPFRDYLHSGSMIYALSTGKPVITPATPFADGLAAVVGRDWVRTYAGPLTLAALNLEVPAGAPDLTPLDWPTLGTIAAQFYRTL